MKGEPAIRHVRRPAEWGVHLAAAYAAWIAFTQKLTPSELLVGAGVSVLAAVASRLVWSRNGAEFQRAGRYVLAGWQVALYAVTGTAEILRVLVRHLRGRPAPSLLLAVPFVPGPDDPVALARRALAVAYTSMTPNFIVLGLDLRRGRLWYHQLERSEVPGMTRRLGALP